MTGLETGRVIPSLAQAQRICEILDIPFLDLIGLEPAEDTDQEKKALEKSVLKYLSEHKDFDLNKFVDAYYYDENGLRFRGDDSLFDKLVLDFEKLNDDGRYEASKRVEELTEIPRYRAVPALDSSEGNEPPHAPEEE